MTIESERSAYLKRMKRDSKDDRPGFAKKIKMPYQTLLGLLKGKSLGTIRSWLKVERYYLRQDKSI